MRYKTSLNQLMAFLEKKDHLIDKLDLEDYQKERLKTFFQKHPGYESKIDWNNRNLQWEDFENLLDLDGKSKSQAKKTGIEGLIEDKDYKILAQNDHYIIYYPLTHLGSKVLASRKVAPYSEGKWCISMNQDTYWAQYTEQMIDFFFIFFFLDEDGDDFSNKFAISRADPSKDPYEEAYDQKYNLSSSDEIDENDYPDYTFNFFDDTDQQYEDWTGLPYFHDICEVIKKTPNYLKDRLFSFERQPGLEIKYSKEVELCSVKVSPGAEGQILKIRPGTTRLGSNSYHQLEPLFSNPKNICLAGADIPDSVKVIDTSAFSLSGITKLVLPGSVEFIGPTIFGGLINKDRTNLEVTFKDQPKKLRLCFSALAGYPQPLLGEKMSLSTVNWPGTIRDFVLCLFEGKSFNAGMLTGGKLYLQNFGIQEVKATDGTFEDYQVFPEGGKLSI